MADAHRRVLRKVEPQETRDLFGAPCPSRLRDGYRCLTPIPLTVPCSTVPPEGGPSLGRFSLDQNFALEPWRILPVQAAASNMKVMNGSVALPLLLDRASRKPAP